MEKPFAGRATITETYNGMEIIIPSKKHWGVIVFMLVWMGGWLFGELSAFGVVTGAISSQGSPPAFMYIWLAGWTFGGVICLRYLIWSLFGKELITFASGQLTIARRGLIPSSTKTYDMREATDFRVGTTEIIAQDSFVGTRPTFTMGMNTGNIWFDYGMKTIRFGAGIDEAEAKHILQRLKNKRVIEDVTLAHQRYL